MKEHAKKAIAHRIEVFGKTVPTLAIAALFLVGGSSAAVLQFYGALDGTATVSQAVTLDGNSCNPDNQACTESFQFSPVDAGETVIETHTLANNAGSAETVEFQTQCWKSGNSDDGTRTGNNLVWSDYNGPQCDGIHTRYVEYYDDAGHDFSGYSSPSESDADRVVDDDGGEDHSTIQGAVDAASTGETILVKDGTYGAGQVGVDVTKPVTLVAENQHGATIEATRETVRVKAADVSIRGFVITTTDSADDTYGEYGVHVEKDSDRFELRQSRVEDIHDEFRSTGVGVDLKTADSSTVLDDAVIRNNLIRDISSDVTQGPQSGSVVKGISLNHEVHGATVEDNTITNLGGQDSAGAHGIALTEEDSSTGPQDFVIKRNDISAPVVDSDQKTGDPFWESQAIFVGGYTTLGSSHEVTENNIGETVYRFTVSGEDTLDANDNWWGTDGIQTTGAVDASWMTKSDMTLDAGETDVFGVINEFAMTMVPDDYRLRMEVVPS